MQVFKKLLEENRNKEIKVDSQTMENLMREFDKFEWEAEITDEGVVESIVEEDGVKVTFAYVVPMPDDLIAGCKTHMNFLVEEGDDYVLITKEG